MYKPVPPVFDHWAYLSPAEFKEAFETFELPQLRELSSYRPHQVGDPYDCLYLCHSVVNLPEEEY